MRRRSLVLGAGMMPLVAGGAARAQGVTGRVTVVTSFSRDVTDPFKRAFERAHPGVTLEVQNRNTNAGVKFIAETRSNNAVDLFWASAPDAFEVLRVQNLLQRYQPRATGIPERVAGQLINDPTGHYFGFAASGYGIMWNERYARARRLPSPAEWGDLAKPEFHDHVSIAAPSRSGTTHLTIETILQGEGWATGWGTIKAFSGNLRSVTERSFGVPDAVNSGQVGAGIVIDFFAFSSQAAGFPVRFVYPTVTAIVPANVAIIANAPNRAGAEAFVEFLLSEAGQEVLLEPTIRRLPVNPAVYAKAPADYPNPFTDPRMARGIRFNVELSESRTAAVDALFDQLISFQLDGLKAATKAIHDAERALAARDNPAGRALLAEARSLVAAMPVTEAEVASGEVANAFRGGTGGTRQAEIEQRWAAFARERYARAKTQAEAAARAR
jgi:ABC-type Fe3+ transport system substrate-binding protein